MCAGVVCPLNLAQIFNRTAVEERRDELVETPLQDILLQLGQYKHSFA